MSNFWDTEQAGLYAESILENRDVVCYDILLNHSKDMREIRLNQGWSSSQEAFEQCRNVEKHS